MSLSNSVEQNIKDLKIQLDICIDNDIHIDILLLHQLLIRINELINKKPNDNNSFL